MVLALICEDAAAAAAAEDIEMPSRSWCKDEIEALSESTELFLIAGNRLFGKLAKQYVVLTARGPTSVSECDRIEVVSLRCG